MKLDSMIESMFCETFRNQTLDHITQCESCQRGLIALYDSLPMLGMIPGLKTKIKELQHGNSKKKREPSTQSPL
jgi:hypothetical protein